MYCHFLPYNLRHICITSTVCTSPMSPIVIVLSHLDKILCSHKAFGKLEGFLFFCFLQNPRACTEGRARKTSNGRRHGGILIRCRNHFSWLLSTIRTSGSTSSYLQMSDDKSSPQQRLHYHRRCPKLRVHLPLHSSLTCKQNHKIPEVPRVGRETSTHVDWNGTFPSRSQQA